MGKAEVHRTNQSCHEVGMRQERIIGSNSKSKGQENKKETRIQA